MADDNNRNQVPRLRRFVKARKNLSKNAKKVSLATLRHAHRFVIKRWGNVQEVRRNVVVWVVVVGLLIAGSGLQLLWYHKSYRTTVAATGGVYAEAVLGPVNTLNPLYASSSAEKAAAGLLFSRLYDYDTSGNLGNDLATSLSVSDNNTVYTVKIRSDARWHDGWQLTASDVEFTVGLIKNSSVRSTIAGWSNIEATAIDDTTIEFKLPAAYAAFWQALTFPILPEHILGDIEPSKLRENNFSKEPIGSGPFQLKLVQDVNTSSGRKIIHLTQNEAYYGGSPKLSRFQLHVYDTSKAIVNALSTGEVNAATDLSANDVELVDDEKYTVTTTPLYSGVYAFFNTTSSVLNDKTVRQALRLGTDTEAIRQKLPVEAPALDLPFITGQISGDLPQVPATDVDKAKDMLDQAGWKLNGEVREKDGTELRLSVVTIQGGEYERAVEVLAGQWRQLGVSIDTQIVDPNNVSENIVQNILQPRNYDVLVYQLEIGSDPDVYAYWHSSQIGSSGFNFSNYSSSISNDALVSARQRLEPSLRNAKYVAFAEQWVEDVPAIGLYQSTMQYARGQDLQSFDASVPLVSSTGRYASVQYWTAGTRTVYKTP